MFFTFLWCCQCNPWLQQALSGLLRSLGGQDSSSSCKWLDPAMYKTEDNVAGAIRVPHRLQAHAHGIRMPRGPPALEGCSLVSLDIHASLLAPSQTWPRAERTSVCTGCSRIGWAPRQRSCLIQQGRDRCDCPRGAPGLSSGTRLKADEAVLWMSSPPVQVPPRCAYGVSIEAQSDPVGLSPGGTGAFTDEATADRGPRAQTSRVTARRPAGFALRCVLESGFALRCVLESVKCRNAPKTQEHPALSPLYFPLPAFVTCPTPPSLHRSLCLRYPLSLRRTTLLPPLIVGQRGGRRVIWVFVTLLL